MLEAPEDYSAGLSILKGEFPDQEIDPGVVRLFSEDYCLNCGTEAIEEQHLIGWSLLIAPGSGKHYLAAAVFKCSECYAILGEHTPVSDIIYCLQNKNINNSIKNSTNGLANCAERTDEQSKASLITRKFFNDEPK